MLCAGSRKRFWAEPDAVRDHLVATLDFLNPSAVLNGGEPTGPDTWAWEWAVEHIEARYNQIMRAQWNRYGRSAGRIRNQAMADRARRAMAAGWEVEVHVWWNGRSVGSMHMIDVATRRGLRVVAHDMSAHSKR